MTIEMLDLFESVYEKMLYKVDKALKDKDVSISYYMDAMSAASAHATLVAEIAGYDSFIPFMEWSVLQDELFIKLEGYVEQWKDIKFTDEMYRKLVARSFALVAEDDFLNRVLGTEDYVGIIEEANWLILKGLMQYEGISEEAGDNVLEAIAEFLEPYM